MHYASRFARIQVATATGPYKRTKLYKLARKHKGLFRKDGNVTIVDMQMLDEVTAQLPPAELSESDKNSAA
jgi:hypothetical protein